MWRLPPLPLPPPVLPLVSEGWAKRTLVTGLLPSRRPSSSLGSSISQRLAPSSSGLAPALGRYSPPLCRGNKMAAAVPPCARIHSPPSWPPWPRPGRCSPGVRTHCGTLPSPWAAYFPLAGAFVCCFGPAHARTCWSTHPLTSRASQRAQKGEFSLLYSLYLFVQVHPWLL